MGKQHLSRDERLIQQGRLKGTRECMDIVAMVLMDKCGWHANEGLWFNLAAYENGERAVEDASPYAVTTDSADVGGGVPDAPHDNEICRAALEAFGAEAQMVMAIEEMSELTKELCKHRRGRDNVEAIAEEIADVEIMLRQMVMLFDCRFTVDRFRRYKLERLAERIKEAKQ